MSSESVQGKKVVSHEGYFWNNFKTFFVPNSTIFSDVTLIVEGASFKLHRIILSAQSEYFKTLFTENQEKSSENGIVLENVSRKSFEFLLQYFYIGRLDLDIKDIDLLMDSLRLSREWNLNKLTEEIGNFIQANLTVECLWDVYESSKKLGFKNFEAGCMNFADRNALQVLEHPSFLKLSAAVLTELLSHDTFFAPEVKIFERLSTWMSTQSELDLEPVLRQVRWSSILFPDFMRISKELNPKHKQTAVGLIVDIYSTVAEPRRYGLPGVNVAAKALGVKMVTLKRDTQDAVDEGILADLKREYWLNCIEILLPFDKKNPTKYSYSIQVSVDQTLWEPLLNYTNFACFGLQSIYFHPKIIRYIKIVGKKGFAVASLQATYLRVSPEQFDKDSGFVVSEYDTVQPVINNCDKKIGECPVLKLEHNFHWKKQEDVLCTYRQPIKTSVLQVLLYDPGNSGGVYEVSVSKDDENWNQVGTLRSSDSPQLVKFDPAPLTTVRISRPEGVKTGVLCLYINCLPKEAVNSGAKK